MFTPSMPSHLRRLSPRLFSARLLSPQRCAYSLIEFAVVLAVMLPIIFGAVDVTNTMRAYNAIEKASEVTLRCIYPTDAACLNHSAVAGTRLFNWLRLDNQERYFVRDVQFRGTGEWLAYPTYTYNRFRARVLNSVSFDLPQVRVTEQVPVMNRSHRAGVLVRRSGLPWVHPLNLQNPDGRQVELRRGPDSSDGLFPETAIVPDQNSTEREINTISDSLVYRFTLPHPLPDYSAVARYKAARSYFESSTSIPSGASFSQVVANANEESGRSIKAVVWVKGELSGQAPGVTSRLRIAINGDELGGQMLGSNGSANFYPRGVGQSHEPGDPAPARVVGPAQFRALAEWSHDVTLRFGQNELRIAATALDQSGNAIHGWSSGQQWTLTDVQVFIPRIQPASFNTSCTATGCGTEPCASFQGLPIHAPGSSDASYPSAFVAGNITNTPTGQTTSTVLGTFTSLAQAQGQQSCNGSVLDVESLEPVAVETICPANFGATSDGERLTVCPPRDSRLESSGVMPLNVRWNTGEIGLAPPAGQESSPEWSTTFTRLTCQTPFTLTAPPAHRAYRDIVLPQEHEFSPHLTRYTPVPDVSSAQRPRDIKAADERYNCPAITIQTLTFDGNTTPRSPANLPSSSLFAGLHPERASVAECAAPLRTEAEQHGLPPTAWFTWTATPVRESRVAQPPTDACTVFRTEHDQSSRPAELIAAALPEQQTPAECVSNPTCTRVFAGFDQSTAGSPQSAPPRIDLERARQIAFEAVVASYPHARQDCSAGNDAKNCLVTAVALDDESAPRKASVRSTIQVPLNLLGGRPFTLSNHQERELENAFLR